MSSYSDKISAFGPCIECNALKSKMRVYGYYVCPFHFKEPQYRLISKSMVFKKYQVDPPTLQHYIDNGMLVHYTLPNPINHHFKAQTLYREWDVWQCFQPR